MTLPEEKIHHWDSDRAHIEFSVANFQRKRVANDPEQVQAVLVGMSKTLENELPVK